MGVLVPLGCCKKKYYRPCGFKKNYITQFSGGWEVQEQDIGRFGVWLETTSSLMTIFSVWRRTRELSGISVIMALIPFVRAPPWDLVTFQRPHLLIPLHWVSGFQHMTLGGPPAFSLSSGFLYGDAWFIIENTADRKKKKLLFSLVIDETRSGSVPFKPHVSLSLAYFWRQALYSTLGLWHNFCVLLFLFWRQGSRVSSRRTPEHGFYTGWLARTSLDMEVTTSQETQTKCCSNPISLN